MNTDIRLDELKRRSDITERARSSNIGDGFSKAIREELPVRFPDASPDTAAME